MKHFFTVLTFLLVTSLHSQGNTNYSSKELKILSWNIYMLPSITNLAKRVKKSDKKKRARMISETLKNSDYDIIVFQEAFHIPSKNILKKGLKESFPFQYGPINKTFFKFNSGIYIVSKVELKELASIQYNECTGIDCWAKKGTGIFEGVFSGKTFQIAGTHLDSGRQSAREKQYIQAYEEILKPFQKDGVPQIFCGDFNTRKSNEEKYSLMLNTYDAEDIKTNSDQKFTNRENNAVIDYILMRRNNASLKVLDKQIKTFKARTKVIERLNGNLSDHLAVEVTIKL